MDADSPVQVISARISRQGSTREDYGSDIAAEN